MKGILPGYLSGTPLRRAGSGWLTRCPAHDDRSPSLSVSFGRGGRVLLKCHAGCSLESILEALGIGLKDLFPSQGGEAWRAISGMKGKERRPGEGRQSDDYLDAVYRHLTGLLGLSESHRAYLLSRGLSENMIARGLYRTLPGGNRALIMEQLTQRFDLSGVPGFGMKSGRFVMTGTPGILLPVFSPRHRLVACQLRPDNDGQGFKYKHLSSSWLERGASPGARLHRVVPEVIRRPELWITEGVFKADLAANILGAIVWSVPGAGNWGEVLSCWMYLPQHVVIAFDNDGARDVKHNVRRLARQLAVALAEKGILPVFALWRRQKGLDDALLAGERIRLWRGRRDRRFYPPGDLAAEATESFK